MRRRILVAVAMLGVLAGSLAPAAARTTVPGPSPAPLPPRLAGTTVLTGAASANMRVTVRRDAVIDLTPVADSTGALAPAALQTSGGGAGHVGFLLTSPGTSDTYVLAARLPRKLQDGASTIAGIGHGQTRDRRGVPQDCVRCAIPAGTYDLHLLTTRRAATVAITIEGLRGRTNLAPGRETLVFGFSAGASPHRHTGTDDGSLSEGGGMGMGMMWMGRSTGVALTTYEMKLLPSRTPAPVGTVEVCRSAGRSSSECEERLVAAAGDSAAGSGVVAASRVNSMEGTMDWGMYGYARYKARMALLWVGLPRAPRSQLHPVAEPETPPGLQLRRWTIPATN